MNFLKLFSTVIRRSGIYLFTFGILGLVIQQILTKLVQDQISSLTGTSQVSLFGYGFLLMLAGFVHPAMMFFFACSSQSHLGIKKFFETRFNQLLIELTRAMGSILSWSLLLLIPGVFKAIRYSFVPFIVCLDPEYDQGKRDALTQSESLANGKMLSLIGIFLLFELAIPLVMTIWEEYQIIWETPISAFILMAVEVLFSTLMMSWLMAIFLASSRRPNSQPSF